MFKLSYYTIFTDALNDKEERILFATRTGESFVVSDSVCQQLKQGLWDDLPTDILHKLQTAKAVVPAHENELLTIVTENKTGIRKNKVLYEVIQPSAMCQLGCYYCGQQHTKDYLTPDYHDLLLQRIRQKAEQGNYTHFSIGWFGGEPLMALGHIRDLTPRFQALAAEFGMSYSASLVTNGLSLKENIFYELTTQLGVTSIEITLDGTATFHDAHRYTKDGGASFDLIFKNLLAICHRTDFETLGCRITVRCNVDARNWEGVSPLIQLLGQHGLAKKIAYFYPIGIYSWGGNDAHTGSLTKEAFAAKEIDWLIEQFEAGFTPSFLPSRVKDVCIAVSPVSEMYDAFGNIYNCTEVSLTDVYKDTPYTLGNLKQNPIAHQQVHRPLTDWNDTLLTDTFPCHTCQMLPVCGGGCPKSWHEDMRACPSAKFNIKERLTLAYVLAQKPELIVTG